MWDWVRQAHSMDGLLVSLVGTPFIGMGTKRCIDGLQGYICVDF